MILPVQQSRYIGRVDELQIAGELLHAHRLVTLLGAGGSGKARLAIQIAVDAAERFPAGVYGPYGIAVDDPTNTVYVANNENGDNPGTVTVIDTATCNGTDTTGCAGFHPRVAIGRSPLLVAVDIHTDTVYITDFSSAGVSVVNGSTCNAEVTSGCHTPAPEQAVGSQPFG